MRSPALLSFALLALAVWTLALPVAVCCLLGVGPVRNGGRAALALFAGTAVVPALALAAVLLTVRVSADGWLDALPGVATVAPLPGDRP